MEGPSLVIAAIEMQKFVNQKIIEASGNSKQIPFDKLINSNIENIQSWGKHLLLRFSHCILRVHFLMYGSYRIDEKREDKIPRLLLRTKKNQMFFYNCSIKEISEEDFSHYEWSADVMSDDWDPNKALRKVLSKKNEMVCDVLMDQNIFAGVGNIIKNEVLFRLHIHPEIKIKNLSKKKLIQLIDETKNYCEEFFEWKVLYIFKSNWRIMRKGECPDCHGKVERRKTGKLKRWSFICLNCQGRNLPAYHLVNG